MARAKRVRDCRRRRGREGIFFCFPLVVGRGCWGRREFMLGRKRRGKGGGTDEEERCVCL